MALKINRHPASEHPANGTTELTFIGKLTDRQRDLLAKVRGRRRPRRPRRQKPPGG